MSERMVEVWFEEKDFEKFIKKEACSGYNTWAVKSFGKTDIYIRCLVSIEQIKFIDHGKIEVKEDSDMEYN
ncbi:hypothetical protein A2331_02850 [Candidatus Falkowbacteria bacterium RIFOXYB2_FULL_34_18]|uniref:Uncharacterized protein n=1 Tax=Candidatus Falkowbacteria bacterium RIFOXYD2_FULL_34_120 TaxID=1798007 RepID=A0A1F5TMD9_9BACT|nr:MAG: hypothetical protein A2331_02850 [Candidatus Falkowbacteria bacterium RIFOXYB2_FULL_34_18]OGF28350.1 MAG: hypothetical protein A2500_03090 [Candidatus Falkowbacteria bacterium RIFOXYC12_FULL_34_55]OGF37931.1 MAG: hypothetical protein A2466_05995 [Candidatus Falkowbacteria bacterium RIFOXYC2_FULL_34_220]OGF39649.1 MAG: hypothetical protein A2515_07290 [Candidatus Falkowbacteria bacterium RIFOXYD12_FULL_34_57]OGF40088.1 MAG: hypothetical protein A2531_04985 [Candidatus Falkowbacteria bact